VYVGWYVSVVMWNGECVVCGEVVIADLAEEILHMILWRLLTLSGP
jgi:hypothetical protein